MLTKLPSDDNVASCLDLPAGKAHAGQGPRVPSPLDDYIPHYILINQHSGWCIFFSKLGMELSLLRQMQRRVKIHQEISLQAADKDNDRTAVQTPQVTSGNGLLTKPYYTACFRPTWSAPSHIFLLVIIPSNSPAKSLHQMSVIPDSWKPKSGGKDAPFLSNSLPFLY